MGHVRRMALGGTPAQDRQLGGLRRSAERLGHQAANASDRARRGGTHDAHLRAHAAAHKAAQAHRALAEHTRGPEAAHARTMQSSFGAMAKSHDRAKASARDMPKVLMQGKKGGTYYVSSTGQKVYTKKG